MKKRIRFQSNDKQYNPTGSNIYDLKCDDVRLIKHLYLSKRRDIEKNHNPSSASRRRQTEVSDFYVGNTTFSVIYR